MNCSRFEALMADLMDGVLDGRVQEAVREHASACASCTALMGEVRQVVAALGSFPVAQPPEGLVQFILSRTCGVPKERSLWRDLVLPTISPFLTQRFAFATGIMFVFLSLMVNILGPGSSTFSASNLSPSSIWEGSAKVASQISKAWSQVQDTRSKVLDEISLWKEDLLGSLDHHLISGLFKSYQEAVREQEEKVRQIDQEQAEKSPQEGQR